VFRQNGHIIKKNSLILFRIATTPHNVSDRIIQTGNAAV